MSPCNPPCASGEYCSDQGACLQALPIEKPRPPGYRKHDGFYLRMGFGAGAVNGNVSGEGVDLDLNGASLALEFAAGVAPLPGFTLGVGFYMSVAPETQVTGTEITPTSSSEFDGMPAGTYTSGLFGPFVDVYPKPDAGLHLQAAVGVGPAGWSKHSESVGLETVMVPAKDYSGSGFAFALGGGYEWWVGGQWGLGALLRFQYGSATLKPTRDSEPGPSVDGSTSAISLLFTSTYQ